MRSMPGKTIHAIRTQSFSLGLTVNGKSIAVFETPNLGMLILHEVKYFDILLKFLFFLVHLLNEMVQVDFEILVDKFFILLP